MQNTTLPHRRRVERIPAALPVRFSINDSEEMVSATIDLTYRSIAVRTSYSVAMGDLMTAFFEGLAPIYGRVVRIFDDGFAVELTKSSLSLIAHTRIRTPHENKGRRSTLLSPVTRPARRNVSPIFEMTASFNCWGRLATSIKSQGFTRRHTFSIISATTLSPDLADGARLVAGTTRWIPEFLLCGTRDQHSVISISLNDWQLSIAGTTGLKLVLSNDDAAIATIGCEAAPFASHYRTLDVAPVKKMTG